MLVDVLLTTSLGIASRYAIESQLKVKSIIVRYVSYRLARTRSLMQKCIVYSSLLQNKEYTKCLNYQSSISSTIVSNLLAASLLKALKYVSIYQCILSLFAQIISVQSNTQVRQYAQQNFLYMQQKRLLVLIEQVISSFLLDLQCKSLSKYRIQAGTFFTCLFMRCCYNISSKTFFVLYRLSLKYSRLIRVLPRIAVSCKIRTISSTLTLRQSLSTLSSLLSQFNAASLIQKQNNITAQSLLDSLRSIIARLAKQSSFCVKKRLIIVN